jgi:hypothetical protein
MRFKRNALWVLLLVLGFAVMAGGCGGGGGGGESVAEVDFDALDGTWIATSGSGTASGYGETATLRLDQGTIEFDLLSLAADEATIRILYDVDWDVYYEGVLVYKVSLFSDDGGDQVLVKRTGANKFNYTYPDGSTIDVTVTSNETATVTERGTYEEDGYEYSYSATYYIDKL